MKTVTLKHRRMQTEWITATWYWTLLPFRSWKDTMLNALVWLELVLYKRNWRLTWFTGWPVFFVFFCCTVCTYIHVVFSQFSFTHWAIEFTSNSKRLPLKSSSSLSLLLSKSSCWPFGFTWARIIEAYQMQVKPVCYSTRHYGKFSEYCCPILAHFCKLIWYIYITVIIIIEIRHYYSNWNIYSYLFFEWEVCTEGYFAQGLCKDRGSNTLLQTAQAWLIHKYMNFIKWLHL